ncbi:STAS domain-containing protein [Thalassovita taeanensis]|nr:STAS domain-containing protein [Thalassovita taeanensis]
MQMSTISRSGFQIVTVAETRIDAAVAIAFKDQMRQLTDGGAPDVVLDLTDVSFIDSSGLGAIVAAMKQLGKDRRLHLAALMPNVDKVFRLTRMDTVFAIHDSVEQAVGANAG